MSKKTTREISFRVLEKNKKNKNLVWSYFDVSKAYPLSKASKETLGQYIGLKDIEGRRIYEGDLVKILEDNGEEVTTEKVEWIEELGLYSLSSWIFNNGLKDSYRIKKGKVSFKVVGNIYQSNKVIA